MSDRRREGDHPPAFPLVFDDERPSILRRVVEPLQRLLSARGRVDVEVLPVVEPEAPEPAGTSVGSSDGKAAAEAPAEVAETSADADARPEAGPVHRLTLHLLPGRLQPIDPGAIGQEVRFLRAGTRETEVTLGWEEGQPPAHITLNHPSIQPRHALMRFSDDQWSIESLSARDPVRVNGEPVSLGGPSRRLNDGDRVQLGDIEFDFVWP
jgi:hypothetical protein